MRDDEKQQLKNHLAAALDILWVNYGNDFGGTKERLIAEIQMELEESE